MSSNIAQNHKIYKNNLRVQTGKKYKNKRFLHGEKYILIFQ